MYDYRSSIRHHSSELLSFWENRVSVFWQQIQTNRWTGPLQPFSVASGGLITGPLQVISHNSISLHCKDVLLVEDHSWSRDVVHVKNRLQVAVCEPVKVNDDGGNFGRQRTNSTERNFVRWTSLAYRSIHRLRALLIWLEPSLQKSQVPDIRLGSIHWRLSADLQIGLPSERQPGHTERWKNRGRTI